MATSDAGALNCAKPSFNSRGNLPCKEAYCVRNGHDMLSINPRMIFRKVSKTPIDIILGTTHNGASYILMLCPILGGTLMGIAVQPTEYPRPTREGIMLDEISIKVLQLLAENPNKAMNFLQLASLCPVSDDELKNILKKLEDSGIVKITKRDDIYEEIVTLREKGLSLASCNT